MIGVGVHGYDHRELLRWKSDFLNIRENCRLGRVNYAGIQQDHCVAEGKILLKVAVAEKRLDLINVRISA